MHKNSNSINKSTGDQQQEVSTIDVNMNNTDLVLASDLHSAASSINVRRIGLLVSVAHTALHIVFQMLAVAIGGCEEWIHCSDAFQQNKETFIIGQHTNYIRCNSFTVK